MRFVAVFLTALALFPAVAGAQEIGVRGGVTAVPAFGFGGVRAAFGAPRPVLFRLEVDFAGGPQRATMFTLAWESKKIHRDTLAWAPYFGGGLTYFLVHTRSLPDAQGEMIGGAFCLFFGVENRRRVSAEIQANFGSAIPKVYFIVGYRFH